MNARTIGLVTFSFVLFVFPSLRASATMLAWGEYPMGGQYIGVHRCANGVGVWTEVTLVDPDINAGAGSGTFVMTKRFTDGVHRGATITTRGLWSTVEWVKGEGYAGTVELRGAEQNGKTPAPRYFYCDHGRSMSLLGADRIPLATSKSVTLQRVTPPPRTQFGPLTEAESHAVIMGNVGDSFDIALPAASSVDALNAWTMEQPVAHPLLLESAYGIWNHNRFIRIFLLKVVAPGSARIAFRSAQIPTQTVTFNFAIAR